MTEFLIIAIMLVLGLWLGFKIGYDVGFSDGINKFWEEDDFIDHDRI